MASSSNITLKLAGFQDELNGIQAQVKNFSDRLADSIAAEGLAERITAVNEGLKDLSEFLKALPQQEAKQASAMRASPESHEGESAKVQEYPKNDLPTPSPSRHLPAPAPAPAKTPPHPSVKLVADAKAAIEKKDFAEAASLLNRAQGELRTAVDPKLETAIMECRKEFREKVVSSVNPFIETGQSDVAISTVQNLEAFLYKIRT